MTLTPQSPYNVRVWLNGFEVTRDCFYVDTELHLVRLYQRDPDMRIRIDSATFRPVTIERSGDLRVERAGKVIYDDGSQTRV